MFIPLHNPLKMSEEEVMRWAKLKFRGHSNPQETSEYEKLEAKWQREKVDLIMQAAHGVLHSFTRRKTS